MASRKLNTRIVFRSGTASAWQLSNIILSAGEPGYETDTNKFKIGDGITSYNNLPYISSDLVLIPNPETPATQALSSVTIGDITYSIGGSIPIVDLGTIQLVQGSATISIMEEQKQILQGESTPIIKFVSDGVTFELIRFYSSGSGIVFAETFNAGGNTFVTYRVSISNNEASIQMYSTTISSQLPTPTTADAGKYVVVAPDGTSYTLAIPNAANAQVISEAAYAELLSSGQVQSNTVYLIEGTSDNTLSVTAATTSYDNTSSGLTATNVQSAIDKLVTKVSGKQDALTFDSSPTQGSNNPVTSAGIYTSLQGKQDVLTLQALATLLGLTQEQLNNLITFTKSITSATTGSTTISGTITADTFNTSQ